VDNSGSGMVLEAALIPVVGIAQPQNARHRKAPPKIDDLDVFNTTTGRQVIYKLMYHDRWTFHSSTGSHPLSLFI
jgi:hypothetical protein